MPAEKFYAATKAEGAEPDLVVSWSNEGGDVSVNDVVYDASAIARLVNVLRRAQRQTEPLRGEAGIAFAAVEQGKDVLIVGPQMAGENVFGAVVERGSWRRVNRANGRQFAEHSSSGTIRPVTVAGARGRGADLVIALGWNTWSDEQRDSVAACIATTGGEVLDA